MFENQPGTMGALPFSLSTQIVFSPGKADISYFLATHNPPCIPLIV